MRPIRLIASSLAVIALGAFAPHAKAQTNSAQLDQRADLTTDLQDPVVELQHYMLPHSV